MEHFILDVSKNTGGNDPQLILQFRRIIAHYRKIADSQIHDPKMKMLFNKVSESFKHLEKHTNLSKDRQNNNDENSDDETSETPEEPTPLTEDEVKMNQMREENCKKSVEQLSEEINTTTSSPKQPSQPSQTKQPKQPKQKQPAKK
jgi:flagellar biosynthesis GTPase FlhF